MNLYQLIKWNRRFKGILLLILIILNLNLYIYYTLAKKDKYVSGFSKKTRLYAGERVAYHFSNNIHFEIKSDTNSNLEIQYSKKIQNKQVFMDIRNENPLFLQINAERSMENFKGTKTPRDPKEGQFELRSQYECIYRIESNSSIEKIVFQFKKDSQYELDPLIEYSIAVYEEDEESWSLLKTEEISIGSEVYLKASISDFEANKDYYITIYEVSYFSYFLIIGSVILAVGILSMVVIISKKDYLQYLKTRTTFLQKGAHRLTLDEVLENENRNKIIDLILNEPGIHFNELLRKSELAPGNLVWHLDILETYKIIGKKRIGNFIAYFPYYQKNPISNIDLKLSKSKFTLDILEMIEKEPGIWSSLITNRKKVDHKTIHYHINKLIDLGLIFLKKEGRKKRIFPNLDSEYYKKSLNST